MEVIIEMEGLEQEDSFTTMLDDKIQLINIAQMIQEAAFYQAFSLSEQFCLQIKDTKFFISGRTTIIKQCLNQNEINPKILIFHKGLEGQMKMKSGKIIDLIDSKQNQNTNQNSNIQSQNNNLNINHQSNNINQSDNNQSLINNQSQNKGIQIGGQITFTQHYQNLEKALNEQNQDNNNNELEQINAQNSKINQIEYQQNSQTINQSLIESKIQQKKKTYNFKLLMTPQEYEKYKELFQKDQIQFEEHN